MNYQLHYDRLIEKYGSWEKPAGYYTERHRKLPECMGGTYVKGNAFYMTAEAHFVAHQLLVKMYPDNHDLAWAAWGMTGDRWGKRNNNKMFGWLKRKAAEATSSRIVSAETRAKQSARMKGRKASAETRKKQSIALTGEKSYWFGKHHTVEQIAAQTGKKRPPGFQTGEKNHQFGKPRSAEYRSKMSDKIKGKKRSAETCKRLSLAQTGEKNHQFGKHPSAETLAKQSVAHKGKMSGNSNPMFGKTRSIESRAKQSASLKATLAKKKKTST